jgi:diguanylate cyclase (GGDEF)-like protein
MGVAKPDGTLTWISINTQPLFRANETTPYAVVSSFFDITERKRTEEELQQANKKLIGWVNELQQRNREIALLGEMSDALQACLTVDEAYSAIANLVQPLFPALSGGIFAISESRNIVEAVATWGIEETERPFTSKNLFAPNTCWALRRGQPHLVEHNHPSLLCKHIHRKLSPEECLCVPMMAQGEALGMVYLSSAQPGQLTEAKQQLAVTVAEHVALALANLKLRETLQHQSIRDPLTGLFNRRYMEESLAREIHRVERKQQPLGIIMLDVDHFKQFNDTFGHEAGDEVLREVGLFLQKYIRDADIACRYGGEEFMLILPDTPLEVIQQRAEQLREDIKHLQVQHRHQYLSKIAFSVGVACFPKHGLTADAVIHAADTALYRAKAAGRDRVVTAP